MKPALLRALRASCISGVLALGVVGCRSRADTPPEADEVATPAADGAMCREHGVLEAVCTKCNPKLATVFQAKGDWCEEHGFPESFCPVCHPERGGRPAAEVEADRAPADGTRIKLKPGIGRAAGIETVVATTRPTSVAVTAPARFGYDATKLARVNARSAGVVRALHVDVGTRVKRGQSLVVIDSPDVGADRARLAAAKSRVTIAQENFTRQEQLHREGIAARKNLLAAQQELDAAKSEHAALAATLSMLGGRSGRRVGGYELDAPLGGVVTERNATIGQLVDPEEVLFEVVDTVSMWAQIDAAESDLPLLALGQSVTLRVDGLGEREFGGEIAYIAPIIDPHTRTAQVRVPVQNPDGLLRANMYAEASIGAGGDRSSVVVPRAAVQRAGDVHLAFVKISETEYETRRVKLGAADAALVEILDGITAGEEVATTGSFLLKTETLKGSIGAGCCEGE